MTSRQLKNRMHRNSERLISQGLGLKAWRHLAQGFIRYSLKEEILDNPAIFEIDAIDPDEAIGASQMHHSSSTGLQVYGRQTTQFPKLRSTQQRLFIEFCQRWHSFIGLGPNFLAFQVFISLFYDLITNSTS